MKNKFYKIISIVLIMTFLNMDLSWAYSFVPYPQQNLAAEVMSQKSFMLDESSLGFDKVLLDSKVLFSVFMTAELLFGKKVRFEDLSRDIYEMTRKLWTEPLTQIDYDSVAPLASLEEAAQKGLSYADDEIPDVMPEEGVIVIPFVHDKGAPTEKHFLIVVADKTKVKEKELIGYKWLVSNKYLINIVPVGEETSQTSLSSEKEAPQELSVDVYLETDKEDVMEVPPGVPSKLKIERLTSRLQKTLVHAFRAIDAFAAAALTGLLFLSSGYGALFLLRIDSPVYAAIGLSAISLYFLVATLKFLRIGVAVVKAVSDLFKEETKPELFYNKKTRPVFLLKYAIAKSNGEHNYSLLRKLPLQVRRAVRLHEAFDSHSWGMLSMLPFVFPFFKKRYRQVLKKMVMYKRAFSGKVRDLVYVVNYAGDPSLKEYASEQIKGIDDVDELLEVLKSIKGDEVVRRYVLKKLFKDRKPGTLEKIREVIEHKLSCESVKGKTKAKLPLGLAGKLCSNIEKSEDIDVIQEIIDQTPPIPKIQEKDLDDSQVSFASGGEDKVQKKAKLLDIRWDFSNLQELIEDASKFDRIFYRKRFIREWEEFQKEALRPYKGASHYEEVKYKIESGKVPRRILETAVQAIDTKEDAIALFGIFRSMVLYKPTTVTITVRDLGQAMPISIEKELKVPTYGKIIEISKDPEQLRRLIEEELEEAKRKAGNLQDILKISNGELLSIIDAKNIELIKHSLAVWKYAQVFAKILGVETNSNVWNILRVACMVHDSGGILGYRQYEVIEERLLGLARENNIVCRGKSGEEVLAAFEKAGIRLSAQEKGFLKYLDHGKNVLRILEKADLKIRVHPKVEKLILRHMDMCSQDEMDSWDEADRIIYICLILGDIFDNGNNNYKLMQKKGEDPESVRGTIHIIKNRIFQSNKYVQEALEKIEPQVLEGAIDEAVEFSRTPTIEANDIILRRQIARAENELTNWVLDKGKTGTSMDLKLLVDIFRGDEFVFLDRRDFKRTVLKAILEMLYRYDRGELIFEAHHINLFKKLSKSLTEYYGDSYAEKILALLHFYWGITSPVMDNFELTEGVFVNFVQSLDEGLIADNDSLTKEFEDKKTLIFEAHHDDAMFAIGDLMSKYLSDSKNVTFATVLSDPIGVDDKYARELTGTDDMETKKQIREREGKKAIESLGITDVVSLGFDLAIEKLRTSQQGTRLTYLSEFKEPRAIMEQEIEELILSRMPEKIILGIPRISYHPHHRDVSKLILKVIHKINRQRQLDGLPLIEIYFYAHVEETYGQLKMHNISPNIVNFYSQEDLERKIEHLNYYDSQLKRFSGYWQAFQTRDINRALAIRERHRSVFFPSHRKHAEGLLKVRMEDYGGSFLTYIMQADIDGAVALVSKAISFSKDYREEIFSLMFEHMAQIKHASVQEERLIEVFKRISKEYPIWTGSLYRELSNAARRLPPKQRKRILGIFRVVKESVKVDPDQQWVIINAGGFGTRTWPMGDRKQPKQFLKVFGKKDSLLQDTIKRLTDPKYKGSIKKDNIIVVTNKDLYPQALAQLKAIGLSEDNIIVEPYRLQDGPAIRLAVEYIESRLKEEKKKVEATIRVITADHVIPDQNLLNETLEKAAHFAQLTSAYVDVGVAPSIKSNGKPDVNKQLGHLVPGDETAIEGIFTLRKQIEKDPFEDYEKLIEEEQTVWNAGYVVCDINVFKKIFSKFKPEEAKIFDEYRRKYFSKGDFSFDVVRALYNDLAGINSKGFNAVEAFAIPLSKLDDPKVGIAFVRGLNADNWLDVGSLDAVRGFLDLDKSENYIAEGDPSLVEYKGDCTGNTVYSAGKGTRIVLHDVKGMIVAHNPKNNSLLVIPRADAASAGRVSEVVLSEGVKQNIFVPHIKGENFPEEYPVGGVIQGKKGNLFVGEAHIEIDSKDVCIATDKGAVAVVNVQGHTITWDKDKNEINVYGYKKPELLNQFVMDKQKKPHPFRASSGYRAAKVTAFLSAYSFFAAVGNYFNLHGFHAPVAVAVIIGVYFAFAAFRYFMMGRGTFKEIKEFYGTRGQLPQQYFESSATSYDEFMKKQAIAKSDGTAHPAYYGLNPRTKDLINIHESFRSHFIGMMALLPGVSSLAKWILLAADKMKYQAPQVIIHRINTHAKLDTAIMTGAENMEMDVQMTKDGYLVLVWDRKVDTPSGEKYIYELTYKELLEVIPALVTLEEVFIKTGKTDITVFLDLKDWGSEVSAGYKEEAMNAIKTLIRKYNMDNKIYAGGFNREYAENIKEKAPKIKTWISFHGGSEVNFSILSYFINRAKRILASSIAFYYKQLTRKIINRVHASGLSVISNAGEGTNLSNVDYVFKELEDHVKEKYPYAPSDEYLDPVFEEYNIIPSVTVDTRKKRAKEEVPHPKSVEIPHIFPGIEKEIEQNGLLGADKSLHLMFVRPHSSKPIVQLDVFRPDFLEIVNGSFIYDTIERLGITGPVSMHIESPVVHDKNQSLSSGYITTDYADTLDKTVRGIKLLMKNMKERGLKNEVLIETIDYIRNGGFTRTNMHTCKPRFIKQVLKQTGCGLLIDAGHLVSTANEIMINEPESDIRNISDYYKKIINKETISKIKEVHISVPYKEKEKWLHSGEEGRPCVLFHEDTEGARIVKDILNYIIDLREEEGITEDLIINMETDDDYATEEMIFLAQFLKEKKPRKKVSISGLYGFIGKHLDEAIPSEKAEKKGLVTDSLYEEIKQPIKQKLQSCKGSMLFNTGLTGPDFDILDSMMPENGVFYHLAALSNPSACRRVPIEAITINSLGTAILAALAKKKDNRFIFTSSYLVYELLQGKEEDYTNEGLTIKGDDPVIHKLNDWLDETENLFLDYADKFVETKGEGVIAPLEFVKKTVEVPHIAPNKLKELGFSRDYVYILSKILAERIVLKLDNSIVLRLSNIYGSFQSTDFKIPGYILGLEGKDGKKGKGISDLAKDEVFKVWKGGSRDYLYIDDCIEALINAGTVAISDVPRIINVTGRELASNLEVAEIISGILGNGAIVAEEETTDREAPLTDNTAFRTYLHPEPLTSLKEGLKQTVHWYAREKMDAKYMSEILDEAEKIQIMNNPKKIPIVSMVVNDKTGETITGHRKKVEGLSKKYSFMTHSEIEALKEAVKRGWDLSECTLYVTTESCYHCARAIKSEYNVGRQVIASLDPSQDKRGMLVASTSKVPCGLIEDESCRLRAEELMKGHKKRRPLEDFLMASKDPRKVLKDMLSYSGTTGDDADLFDWAGYNLLKKTQGFTNRAYYVNANRAVSAINTTKTEDNATRLLLWIASRIDITKSDFKFIVTGGRENAIKVAESILESGFLPADKIYLFTDLNELPVKYAPDKGQQHRKSVYSFKDEELLNLYHKEGFFYDHIRRVVPINEAIANQLHLNDYQMALVKYASLFHDLGGDIRAQREDIFSSFIKLVKAEVSNRHGDRKRPVKEAVRIFVEDLAKEMGTEVPEDVQGRYVIINKGLTSMLGRELTEVECKVALSLTDVASFSVKIIKEKGITIPKDLEILILYHDDHKKFLKDYEKLKDQMTLTKDQMSLLISILYVGDKIEHGNNKHVQRAQRDADPEAFPATIRFVKDVFHQDEITDLRALNAVARLFAKRDESLISVIADGREIKGEDSLDFCMELDIEDFMGSAKESRRSHVRNVIQHFRFFKDKDFEKFLESMEDNKIVKQKTPYKEEYIEILNKLYEVYQSLTEKQKEALDIAVIFHDMGYGVTSSKGEGHNQRGKDAVKEPLKSYGIMDEELIKNVQDIIFWHGNVADIGVDWVISDYEELLGNEILLKQLIIMDSMDSAGKLFWREDNSPSARNNILSSQLLKEFFELYTSISVIDPYMDFLKMRLRFAGIKRPFQISRSIEKDGDVSLELTPEEEAQLFALYSEDPEKGLFTDMWTYYVRIKAFPIFLMLRQQNAPDYIERLYKLMKFIALTGKYYQEEVLGRAEILNLKIEGDPDKNELYRNIVDSMESLFNAPLEDITSDSIKLELENSKWRSAFGIEVRLKEDDIFFATKDAEVSYYENLFNIAVSTNNNTPARMVDRGNRILQFLAGVNPDISDQLIEELTLTEDMTAQEIKAGILKIIDEFGKRPDVKVFSPEEITKSILEIQSGLKDLEAIDFLTRIRTLARLAKAEDPDKKLVLAIDLDWIPGYAEGTRQHKAMNGLVHELRTLGQTIQKVAKDVDNVVVITGSGSTLRDEIYKHVDKDSEDFSNLLILASEDTVRNNLAEFKTQGSQTVKKGAYIAGVDASGITDQDIQALEEKMEMYFVDILQMVSILCGLALGRNCPESNLIAKDEANAPVYNKDLRYVLFLLPDADPVSWEKLTKLNEAKLAPLRAL